jgi:hypothetical protein
MTRKRSLLLFALLLALIAITAASVFVSYRAAEQRRREKAAQQHSVEARDAISKGAKFLKPDTTSDLRFGKTKSTNAVQQPTPTPTAPR